jgi:hypothetical protein
VRRTAAYRSTADQITLRRIAVFRAWARTATAGRQPTRPTTATSLATARLATAC